MRREAGVTFVDAGNGWVDVLNATGDPQEYGVTLDAAIAEYGWHPVRSMAWVAEHAPFLGTIEAGGES